MKRTIIKTRKITQEQNACYERLLSMTGGEITPVMELKAESCVIRFDDRTKMVIAVDFPVNKDNHPTVKACLYQDQDRIDHMEKDHFTGMWPLQGDDGIYIVKILADDQVSVSKSLHNVWQPPIHTKFLHPYMLCYEDDETGAPLNYEIVSRNPKIEKRTDLGSRTNAVCIIPIFGDSTVLAIREYRYAIGDYCLEFPAGLIEEGETAEEAAIRELKEETGLDTVRVFGAIPGGYSSVGMTDEKVAIVMLEVTGEYRDTMEGREEIHPFRTSFRELWELCQTEKCSGRLQCFLAGMMFMEGIAFDQYDATKKKLVAYDIEWDVDEEDKPVDLPNEIEIPDEVDTDDAISDYLSDFTGFCHCGYRLKEV